MKTFFPNRPNVVATVTQRDDLDFLSRFSGPAMPELLEFRLDNLAEYLEEAEKVISTLPGEVGVLTTVRHPAEGGAGNLDDIERAKIYQRFLPASDLIDTEVRSLTNPALREVVSAARARGVTVVASFHDFEGFPAEKQLFGAVDRAYEEGADLAKIAVVVTNFRELDTLVELVESRISQGRAISAMGMGPLGKLSRLVLAKAGSSLNYGYLQKENAPGQWSATRLKELIGEL